jgi:tetratricopeptide (TPR) repeat protein
MARTGQSEAAEPLCREAAGIAKDAFGEHSRVTCIVLNNLGLVLIERREYPEAESIFRSLVRLADQEPGRFRDVGPVWMNNLAVALRSEGRSNEAAALVAQANDLLEKRHEADPVLRGYAKRNLALSLLSAGKLEEAQAAYREAFADQRHSLGMAHPNTRLTVSEYAALLERLGRGEEAQSLRRTLTQTAQTYPSSSQPAAGSPIPPG